MIGRQPLKGFDGVVHLHETALPGARGGFDTPLDDVLRRANVDTVVLIGTTTPNCIRSTCYDALSLNYNVAIIEDCTSSRTPDVQRANIEDMAFIGAHVLDCATFCEQGLADMPDTAAEVAAAVRVYREAL